MWKRAFVKYTKSENSADCQKFAAASQVLISFLIQRNAPQFVNDPDLSQDMMLELLESVDVLNRDEFFTSNVVRNLELIIKRYTISTLVSLDDVLIAQADDAFLEVDPLESAPDVHYSEWIPEADGRSSACTPSFHIAESRAAITRLIPNMPKKNLQCLIACYGLGEIRGAGLKQKKICAKLKMTDSQVRGNLTKTRTMLRESYTREELADLLEIS